MPKEDVKNPIAVSVIGASGYTGLELIKIMINHPMIKLKFLVSNQTDGQKMSQLYPHLEGICDMIMTDASPETVAEESDCVFLALPHGVSQSLVPRILGRTRIVDLAGDFRLQDPESFERFYGPHQFSEGIAHFIYGLPELNRDEIKSRDCIANPGCFATVAQLALLPLKGRIKRASLVMITGSSGSGKSPSEVTHHPIRSHNLKSYQINSHRHIPEVLQGIGLTESELEFVPISGPFVRGIHATAFITTGAANVAQLYAAYYREHPFVRVKKQVQIADICGSNFCDIAVMESTEGVIVQAVIDNLVKGAAGAAIQNFNLMYGLDETLGLSNLIPLFP